METTDRGPGDVPAFLLEALDAVYRLEQEQPPVSAAQLARRAGLSKAAATERLLALQSRGLVGSDLSGRVRVTSAGERVALQLIRRHRLLECLLAGPLKLPWDRVHEQACRLTPVVSDEVADGLARLLGEPATCPHGNPIPTSTGSVLGEAGIPLHELHPGQRGIILRIQREEPELLRYLAALGLLPQTTVEVDERAPFGGPILVRAGGAQYALGRKVAARIFVRPL